MTEWLSSTVFQAAMLAGFLVAVPAVVIVLWLVSEMISRLERRLDEISAALETLPAVRKALYQSDSNRPAA